MFKIKKLTNVGNIDKQQDPTKPLYGTHTLKNIQFKKLSKLRDLFMHAIEGVNSALDTQETIKIISHVSSGGNCFFNNLIGQGVNIDIFSIL